jgi:NAD(P)-dependent dehydrogenase (short-subunit alcohol dehydrogenase family)
MPGFLEGQLAVVTGASRGNGAAIAEALAREGAHVVLTARDAIALEAVDDRIHEAGGSSTLAPLDLTQPDAIARLAAAMGNRWHALDILVLNLALPGEEEALIAGFDTMLRRSPGSHVIAKPGNLGRTPRAIAEVVIELLRKDVAPTHFPRLRATPRGGHRS